MLVLSQMDRSRRTKRRHAGIVILALIVAAYATITTINVLHDRKISQVRAILKDPVTTAAAPNHFGLEVAPAKPNRTADDDWQAFCHRARASLIEEARIASAASTEN